MPNIIISRHGQQYGPYTLDDVQRYVSTGELLNNDLAWTEGYPDWMTLKELLSKINAQNTINQPVTPINSTQTTSPPQTNPPISTLSNPTVAPTIAQYHHDMPEGVKGWSWGAFWLAPFWAIGNQVWVGLLAFVPVLHIFVHIWLAISGRELAWKSSKWKDVEHFKRIQSYWTNIAWAGSFFIALGYFMLAYITAPEYTERFFAKLNIDVSGWLHLPHRTEEGKKLAAQKNQTEPPQAQNKPVDQPQGNPVDQPQTRPTQPQATPDTPTKNDKLPLTRARLEAIVKGRRSEEIRTLLGAPNKTGRSQNVVAWVYTYGITINPKGFVDPFTAIVFDTTKDRVISVKYPEDVNNKRQTANIE